MKKLLKNSLSISVFIIIISFLVVPLLGFAVGGGDVDGGDNVLIKSVTQVKGIFSKIVEWMYDMFWILAVGFVIWAAYLFLSAGDDTEQIGKAKTMLIYAVIAAAVVLVANGIEQIVKNLIST